MRTHRAYPTKVSLPAWSPQISPRLRLSGIKVSEPAVVQISEEADMKKGLFGTIARNLFSKSGTELSPPLTLDPKEIISIVEDAVPTDGTEIVEWMHISYAESLVMQDRIAEYNSLGSQLVGNNGDAYIPGVSIEDARFVSTSGNTVVSTGYGVLVTPYGNMNVPAPGKTTGVFKNYLCWGSISWVSTYQWTANVLKWKALTNTPITQSLGFFMDGRGQNAPQFVTMSPNRPAMSVKVVQKYTVPSNQTVTVTLRDVNDFTRIISQLNFSLPSGQSEVSFRIWSLPYVPPMVVEIQPGDGVATKLDEFTAKAGL